MNNSRNKIVFASDFHLGIDTDHTSKERELRIVDWLMSLRYEMKELFLVGDIFDYWFEYKTSIPKGFSDFLSALKILRNDGVKIHFFTGNHDLWMFDYFQDQFDIAIYKYPIELKVNDSLLLVGHGDGLGPGDTFYKLLKRIFTNKIAQWIFRWIHPDLGIGMARKWSKSSRLQKAGSDEQFLGEKEFLIQYCRKREVEQHHDLYIFGHRHLPLNVEIQGNSRYYNLGEWVHQCTYGVFDGKTFSLQTFEDNE